MNRIISILIACLLHATLSVASAYNLRVEVTPGGAGTLNTSSGTYEQGASIYLRTYNNTGYQFKGWFDGDTLLSSSTNFYYTMPARDALVQARYEYDPTVPGNPAMPDTTKYYTFSATVTPVGAGTLNIYSGKYAANANIGMRAYVNSGYHFAGWRDENGDTLSTSTSYTYKMPQKDAHLTALYYYDPEVPANPNPMGISRKVTVECKPIGGGTFNTSNTKAEAGSSLHLYSYTNTGYKFLHWENEEGETIATGRDFNYTVPDRDSKIYGIFEYDPAVPGNPNKNYWNKDFGEVIVDDFNAGSLSSAISTAISGSSSSDVAMITVAGRMNSNDFGIANNYSNCTLLDLSRVTGITEVPSYAFDYSGLESVYLPSTIEKIGYRAFYDCTRLSSLTIYSMTPPALENYVFDGVPEGLIIYVPAAVIAQYQEADGWKDFTFLPIQEDIRSLTVNLPAETIAADYKQMWLELTNVKSGQRLHYILTDRTVYTFPNLIRNTTWNVQLRNEAGDIFGKIENVEVKDEDVTTAFASLKKPQTASLKVLTPDSNDITSQVQITWTDANGKYLSQQPSIGGLIEGKQLRYQIALPQNAAMQYNAPAATEYIVNSTDNNIVYTLTNIPQLTIEGKVTDTASGQPVKEATVSASQTFAGIYSKVTNVRTAADGTYKLQLLNTPTVVSISANDYISQSIVCDSLIAGVDKIELPETKLKGISGAILNINFTYTKSVEEGATAESINWYNDYNNVSYTIYNKTKGRAVSQFSVQYPQIVLLEEVDDGDQLQVTATSLNAAFKAVECTAAIADQKADFTFDILELGEISANFKKTTNATVAAILYDADGKLIKSYDYNNATLTISNLADGRYTLVSMGGSRILNTIYDLSKFAEAGLTQGSDYVQQTVEVKSGTVSKITFDEVPLLDESKFYYTGSGTSFTVNKTSIVSGNYLTLTGKIDFKQEYAGKVSNVSLVVDLPAECSFVENSVMVGNSTSSYMLDGNRLTIPMARYTDRVRFCVIPTKGGEYAPGAFVNFDINGESISQPIGAAYYTAKDLSISVPSTISSENFKVNGMAPGGSQIEVYEDDVLIGNALALANGTWTAECIIPETYNFTSHNIYAIITTKAGLKLKSESGIVEIDRSHTSPKTVLMTFYNNWLKQNVNVTFDFINLTIDNPNYMFYTKTKLTFVADFTDNNPEHLSDVVLWTLASNKTETAITMSYDKAKDKWIGSHDFDYYTAPINLTLEYAYNGQKFFDRKQFSDFNGERESILVDNIAEREEFISKFDAEVPEDEITLQLAELFSQDEPDEEEIIRLLNTLNETGNTDCEIISDDEFELMCQQADNSWSEWKVNGSAAIRATILADYYADPNFDLLSDYEITSEFEESLKTVSKKKLASVNPEELVANGYSAITLDDGSEIYVLYSENKKEFIDCGELMQYSIIVEPLTSPTMKSRAILPVTPVNYLYYAVAAKNAIHAINNISTTDTRRWLVDVAKKIDEATENISKFYESFMNDFNQNIETAYSGLSILCDEKLEEQETLADAAQEKIKEYTDKINANKNQREILKSNRDFVKNSSDIPEEQKQKLIQEFDSKIQKLTDDNKHLNGKRAGANTQLNRANTRIAEIKKESSLFRKTHTKIRETLDKFPKRLSKGLHIPKYLRICGKLAGGLALPLQCWSLFTDMIAMSDDISEWIPLMDRIDSHHCYKKRDPNAVSLHEAIYNSANWHAWQNVAILSSEIGAIGFSIAGGVPGSPTWWGEMGLSMYAECVKYLNDNASLNDRTQFWIEVGSLKCKVPEDESNNNPNNNNPNNNHNYPFVPANPIHDPSGYVYEGVSSNRVQGATATVYYKEMVEDMYGDLHENIVKWNAEEYAQENPLFTDENGMYRWDVPQGLWQVKFEKEGYETTYSEWLPVPPPQLEVNIAMKQNVQPNVETARAFEDAIEVKFDKYMLPELLNTENIVVTAAGNAVEGSVELLDEEVSYEGLSEKYASKIRFNASEPFPAKEVTLMVKNRVKSYAGVRMQDDYSQSFTVELEVRKIECDSAITVIYGEENSMMVKVLPASAAAGKTLNVKALSSMLFTVDATSAVLDENGCAEITMSGELPGTSALRFDIDGYDISASTIVNVKMREAVVTATPTASIASGAEVGKGTKLYLNCETENATIYYTLDGSCPCDESDAVKIYDGNPIILTESVTIKAMATAEGMMESDVAEFMYTVNNLYLRGDADNSGNVDLLDINATLNYILGERDNNLNLMQMDSNGDGSIDLLDINTTLDIILTDDNRSLLNNLKKRMIVIPNIPVL